MLPVHYVLFDRDSFELRLFPSSQLKGKYKRFVRSFVLGDFAFPYLVNLAERLDDVRIDGIVQLREIGDWGETAGDAHVCVGW